jgi:iron complex transport system substrate-binding protein
MRICSLFPGATEIAYLLGLGEQVVGVTHECDYPSEAQYKPIVVRSAIDASRMSGAEIDRTVAALLHAGKGLYRIDQEKLAAAAPDLILTQGLCEVCALDYSEVLEAARRLERLPEIVSLAPRSLSDLFDGISRIGAATGREAPAQDLVRDLRARVDCIALADAAFRPRVVCLEWLDPLYVAGHWVPEMIALAGGFDVLGHKGEPSHKVEWRNVLEAQPDMLLLMPCGFDVRRTVKEAAPLRARAGWSEIPAVKNGSVYALNGNAYFSRPGPRLVNGLEILARMLQPDASPSFVSRDAEKLN